MYDTELTADQKALYEHTADSVREFLSAITERPFIQREDPLNTHASTLSQCYHLMMTVSTSAYLTRVDTHTATNSYAALAALMIMMGYWDEDTAQSRFTQHLKHLHVAVSKKVNPNLKLMDNTMIRGYLPNAATLIAFSPLADALLKKLDLTALVVDEHWVDTLVAVRETQISYQQAVRTTNRSNRKHDKAVIEIHRMLAPLVSDGFVPPVSAMVTTSLLDAQYLQSFLPVAHTPQGKARIVEMMMYVLDTKHTQHFNTKELAVIVDNEEHEHLPISLVYQLTQVHQGHPLKELLSDLSDAFRNGIGAHHLLPNHVWAP